MVALYIAAGVLELAGIGLVVVDVVNASARARKLAEQLKVRIRVSRHTSSDRAPVVLAHRVAEAERDLGDAIIALTGGRLRRRLIGPGLLVAGVIVGTAANIASLHCLHH